MGETLFFDYIPAAKLDESRKRRLRAIVAAAEPVDWEDRGYESAQDCRDEMVTAVEYLDKLPTKETLVIVFPEAAYPVVVTGGMASCDPPTEAYEKFNVLWHVVGLIEQLAIWAKEDRRPKDDDDSGGER